MGAQLLRSEHTEELLVLVRSDTFLRRTSTATRGTHNLEPFGQYFGRFKCQRVAPVPEASVAITDFIARRDHDLVQAYRRLYDRGSAGATLLGVASGSYVLFDLAGKSAAGLGHACD